MPTRFRKFLQRTLTAIAALTLIQFVTYFWYAESIIPRTGIRNLSDYGLLRNQEFVVLEPDAWATLSSVQREVLKAEVLRFTNTIYYSIDKVPENRLKYEPTTDYDKANYEDWKKRGVDARALDRLKRELDAGRRIIGLKNGIQLGCVTEKQGLFWIICAPHHWVGNLGAEGRSDLYIWVLGFWVRVYSFGGYMS